MGAGTGDEVQTQEEEEDDDEQDDFGSQLSLNSSTHENGVRSSSFFTLSTSFKATARFILLFDSPG